MTTTTMEETVTVRRSSSSFWHAAWYRYKRNKLALVSGVIAILILIVAALAPLIAPYGYATQDLSQSLAGPSLSHLLGTDQLGRDLLSRAIYGARTSMAIAIGAPLLGALIGIPIGIVAGWFGGITDWITLRAFEVFTMVPQILMALLVALSEEPRWIDLSWAQRDEQIDEEPDGQDPGEPEQGSHGCLLGSSAHSRSKNRIIAIEIANRATVNSR